MATMLLSLDEETWLFLSQIWDPLGKLVNIFLPYIELEHAAAFDSEAVAMFTLKYQYSRRAIADNQVGL